MAVLMILLAMPESVRDSELLIMDDSTATTGAILKGSSSDKGSRELVGPIWLLLGAFQCTMRIEHTRGETNPGDCFSRPLDAKKILEARALLKFTGGRTIEPVWPQTLGFRPSHWFVLTRAVQGAARLNKTPTLPASFAMTAAVASPCVVELLECWFAARLVAKEA